MKINVTQGNERYFRMRLPRWLYLNSFGATLIALRRDVPIKPKQARKAIRAVKKAMKKHNLSTIAQIEVTTDDTNVNIEV